MFGNNFVKIILVLTLLIPSSTVSGQAILTNDSLTGLPLLPPTEAAKKVGNEPAKMPDGTVCNSKMKGNFYKLYDYFSKDNINLTDAVAWYSLHLSGFKKVEAGNHSQTIFYNSDRTLLVILTSESSATGGAAKARSVAYERYQPGISEQTVISLSQKRIVCN